MPRDYHPKEAAKRNQARRDHALARRDLREPTTPRAAAIGATSHAIKVMDPAIERMIAEALAKRSAQ